MSKLLKYTVTATAITASGKKVFTSQSNFNNLTKNLLEAFHRKHPEIISICSVTIESNKGIPLYCMIYSIDSKNGKK